VFTIAGDDGASPKDFNECVSQTQLQTLLDTTRTEIGETITRAVTKSINGLHLADTIADLNGRITTLTNRIAALETHPPPQQYQDVVYDIHGNVDEAATREAHIRGRVRAHNAGGNRAPPDPYAKVKFTLPSFSGSYDADGYLDWEMTVEQKFNAHLVPEQHRVRQASSEFKDFAIIWWSGLVVAGLAPTTWEALKVAMRDTFVPPYHRELRKKLMRLDQGDKSVQDYYGELQKGLMHCGIVEEPEDELVRFYSGLRHEIQDIVDYKEFTIVNQLFQFAMLVEKELQGRHLQEKTGGRTSFAPRTQAHSGLPKSSSFRASTPLAKKTTSGVAPTPNKTPPRAADSGKSVSQAPAQSS
jgi:hypothetical protein